MDPARSRRRRRLLFVGPHVRDPVLWQVIEQVCDRLDMHGVAVAPALEATPWEEHRQLRHVVVPPVGSPLARILPLPRGRRTTRALRCLRLLRRLDPDVVLLTVEPHDRVILDVLAALAFIRKPVVVAMAMENRVSLPSGWRGVVIRRLWRRIDGLAAAASATASSFRRAGMPEQTPWIPLVVAVGDPAPGPSQPTPTGPFRVGYVGRLVAEKGVEDLVEAAAACPGAALVLAGPGPLEEELRARAREPSLAGRLQVLGLVDRAAVWQLLRDVEVLALLSRTEAGWSEQFGYVLAEAMAVGTPLLGSDSGGIPEVIGPAGLVVPERSPSSAAAAIRRLQDDPDLLAALGAAARDRYVAEFSVESCASKLAAFIEGRIAERRP